jgi:hypothetical protein
MEIRNEEKRATGTRICALLVGLGTGAVNLDNGFVIPVVTGFDSARGLLFIGPDGDNDGDDK